MKTEYALMYLGLIQNVINTAKTKAEVQEAFPEYEVLPLSAVGFDAKRRYRYWGERP